MPKISKRTVDAAKPDPDRRVILWDDTLKGFGLLLLPSGVKSYFFNYRNKHGRERRATIGKHGTWTPDKARNRAEAMQREVAVSVQFEGHQGRPGDAGCRSYAVHHDG